MKCNCLFTLKTNPNGFVAKSQIKHTESRRKSVNVKLIYMKLFIKILKYLPPANIVCEGYIFTGVCDSVNRGGGMRGFIWGACVVFIQGGHAWFYSGGPAWFYSGGHAWFYLGGGMHGFIGGGMRGFIWGGHAWFFQFFRIQ